MREGRWVMIAERIIEGNGRGALTPLSLPEIERGFLARNRLRFSRPPDLATARPPSYIVDMRAGPLWRRRDVSRHVMSDRIG